MKNNISLLSLILFLAISLSSSKCQLEDCFEDRKTVKEHTNIRCTVARIGITDEFYLQGEEEGVRFKPCLLPKDFKIDQLQVVCSGLEKEIYANERWPGTPFAITEIEKVK